ncbi:hypothetical protein AX16_007713 [Volvariella volvacea WC 439]|nr:hypothetical protein AX16_007713 [Volvariella volvacea WC 439]
MMDSAHSAAFHALTIERCPNELLVFIRNYLSRSDALALRLTSRHLNVIFTQFVVQELHLSWVSQYQHTPGISNKPFYKLLSHGIPFEPTPEAFLPYITSLRLHFPSSCLHSPEGTKSSAEIANIFAPFWKEIRRLTALKTVSVEWDESWKGFDADGVRFLVLDEKLSEVLFRRTRKQLYALNLEFPAWIQPPHFLSEIFGLERLSISCFCSHWQDGDEYHGCLRSQSPRSFLGDTILRNPDLRHIKVTSSCHIPICKLEELFPPGLRMHPLETVFVMGSLFDNSCDLHISPTQLPTMNNLRQLQLYLHASCPPTTVNLDPLWIALQDCGAQLSKLHIDYGLSDALLKYLASYKGLEDCQMDLHLPGRVSPALGLFTEAVLPAHAPTLSSLHIVCRNSLLYSGCENLTLNSQTWPSPSSFTHLEYLSIHAPPYWSLTRDACQEILDYASGFPQLYRLHIRCSRQEVEGSPFLDDITNALRSIGEGLVSRKRKLGTFEVSYARRTSCWKCRLFPSNDISPEEEGASYPFYLFQLYY